MRRLALGVALTAGQVLALSPPPPPPPPPCRCESASRTEAQQAALSSEIFEGVLVSGLRVERDGAWEADLQVTGVVKGSLPDVVRLRVESSCAVPRAWAQAPVVVYRRTPALKGGNDVLALNACVDRVALVAGLSAVPWAVDVEPGPGCAASPASPLLLAATWLLRRRRAVR